MFVKKAKIVHGDKYSYPEEYVCSRTPINILCNKHNTLFSQRPSAHLQGQGCPICGEESRKITSSLSKEEFVRRSLNVYGKGVFDYADTIVDGLNSPVTIRCIPCNKEFTVSVANNHLTKNASNCMACKTKIDIQKRKEKFVKKAKLLYDWVSGYEDIIYINNTTPIRLFCNLHKEYFSVTPMRHTDREKLCGCPSCGKESMGRWSIQRVMDTPDIENKTGFFYYGKISVLPENCVKIGVTNSIRSRKSKYKRDLHKYEGCFVFDKYIKGSYLDMFKVEAYLKKLFTSKKYTHSIEFGGKNETYIKDEAVSELLNSIMTDNSCLGSLLSCLKDIRDNSFDITIWEELPKYYKEVL